MPKPWETEEFLRLQAEWYERLSKDGFVDHERIRNGFGNLINRASKSSQLPEVIRQTRAEYYRAMAECLKNEKDISPRDAVILAQRIEGITILKITANLAAIGSPIYRLTVGYIIRRWEHKWGIRNWSPAELYPNWKTSRRTRS